VLAAFPQNALAATSNDGCRDLVTRDLDRAWIQTRTAATGDTAHSTRPEFITNCATHNRRRELHLRSENKEGHALLKARAWSSSLLATQGGCGDVTA
jgi:hypothetical protein